MSKLCAKMKDCMSLQGVQRYNMQLPFNLALLVHIHIFMQYYVNIMLLYMVHLTTHLVILYIKPAQLYLHIHNGNI